MLRWTFKGRSASADDRGCPHTHVHSKVGIVSTNWPGADRSPNSGFSGSKYDCDIRPSATMKPGHVGQYIQGQLTWSWLVELRPVDRGVNVRECFLCHNLVVSATEPLPLPVLGRGRSSLFCIRWIDHNDRRSGTASITQRKLHRRANH